MKQIKNNLSEEIEIFTKEIEDIKKKNTCYVGVGKELLSKL